MPEMRQSVFTERLEVYINEPPQTSEYIRTTWDCPSFDSALTVTYEKGIDRRSRSVGYEQIQIFMKRSAGVERSDTDFYGTDERHIDVHPSCLQKHRRAGRRELQSLHICRCYVMVREVNGADTLVRCVVDDNEDEPAISMLKALE